MANALVASKGSETAARNPKPNVSDWSVRPVISALIAIFLITQAAPVFANDPAPWQGRWVSAASENIGSGFANRTFDLSDWKWTLAFAPVAREPWTQFLSRLDISGPYMLGALSGTVADGPGSVYMSESHIVTPLSEPAVAMSTSAGCTLALNLPMDATLGGCGFMPSGISFAVEHDLIGVNGDEMRMGDRSGYLAQESPTAPSAFPLVRKS